MGRVAEAFRPKSGGGGQASSPQRPFITAPSPPGLSFASTTLPMKGRGRRYAASFAQLSSNRRAIANGGGAWIVPCVPASTARASARVSQATASSSV